MNRLGLAILTFFLLSLLTSLAMTDGSSSNASVIQVQNQWTSILSKTVTQAQKKGIKTTVVDYPSIQKMPEFKTLLELVNSINPDTLPTQDDQLSFWINVYNIAAVNLILKNEPAHSIKDLGSLFKSVWKREAIMVGGTSYSLATIEHDILRSLNEPRLHFAIVCASLSCPDLQAYAYQPAILDQQLNASVMGFLSNDTKGVFENSATKQIEVSKIFKWFKDDFGEDDGVRSFLSRYLKADYSHYKLTYLDYNWDLNGR